MASACRPKPTPSHSTLDKATIEPNQSTTFTATVTKQEGGVPNKDIPVSVEVKVDATSGGHDHGEAVAPRPKGTLSTTSGNTSFPVTFTATDVSGKHTITATCDLCENKTASVEVTVKVDGLEPIPDSQFYSLTEPDPTPENPNQRKFVGATPKHSDNHYLKPEAANYLLALAIYYQTLPQFKKLDWRTGAPTTVALKPFAVNDASLVWGGKFDISGKWKGSHKEHMRGASVDIRANQGGWSAIPPSAFKVLIGC
jgi:hypothetical protein